MPLLDDLRRSIGIGIGIPVGMLFVSIAAEAGEVGEVTAEGSFTMFLHEDNLSSRAPTFLSKSPTMFNADSLAEGVSGPPEAAVDDLDGLDLELFGGVCSRMASADFSPITSSAACLTESGLDLPRLLLCSSVLLFESARILNEDLSLSGASLVVKTFNSDRRSRVSSFILCTAAFKLSFSSSSDSRKALRSMAAFILASKSSREAMVDLFALSKSSFCCSNSRMYLLS